jgi:murein DD-endopeptidase MepM/ murein hydrolase activator NlpD
MPRSEVRHACSLAIALGAPGALANTIVVQPGDNLWSIARAHGTTVAALMAANGMDSDDRLPEAAPVAATPAVGQVCAAPGRARRRRAGALRRDGRRDPRRAAPATARGTLARAPIRHDGRGAHGLNGLTSDALRPGTNGLATQTASRPPPHRPRHPRRRARRQPLGARAPYAHGRVADGGPRSPRRAAPGLLTVPLANAAAPAAPRRRPRARRRTRGPAAAARPRAAAPRRRAAPAPAPAPASYTVRAGDSLYEIALAHGVSVDDLIAWNDLDGTSSARARCSALAARHAPPRRRRSSSTSQPATPSGRWRGPTARRSTPSRPPTASAPTARCASAWRSPSRAVRRGPRHQRRAGADVGGAAAAEVRVVPGDNLWKIARQHNTTIASLMSLNGLPHDRLVVGQTLRVVPGPDLGVAAAAVPRGARRDDGMVWPLVGQITSPLRVPPPRIGGTNMHYGLDIDGDIGDPIRSATAGTVTFAGWRGGFGNLVIVDHGDTEYYYAHASRCSSRRARRSPPGQLIARVGATGNVTGPHLHFEIRVDGTAVDPLPILESRAGADRRPSRASRRRR